MAAWHCAAPIPALPSMSDSSAQVLEFPSLRQILASFTCSALGRSRIATLEPSTDATWIAQQQQLTQEVRFFLRTGSHFDFAGLSDPRALLEKSRIHGAALEIEELRELIVFIDRAAQWRSVGP